MKRRLSSNIEPETDSQLFERIKLRESTIQFYDEYEGKNHIYVVDAKKVNTWNKDYTDKLKYVSTTTVIKELFPKFDEDAVISRILENGSAKYQNMTANEIKNLWKDIRDVASFRGTRMHAYFEAILKNEPLPVDLDGLRPGDKNYVDKNGLTCNLACSLLKEEFSKPTFPYKNLKNFNVFRSEWRLFDEKHYICGTVDCVLVNPNNPRELIVVDWKRSKGIVKQSPYGEFGNNVLTAKLSNCNFIHYSIQLNIYRKLIEDTYPMNVIEMYIININATTNKCEIFPVIRLDGLVNAIFTQSLNYRSNVQKTKT